MAPDPVKFAKYLTVTARDVKWGAYCTTVGYTRMPPAAEYPPDPGAHPPKYLFKWEMGRIYDEYALVYITRRRGHFKTEGDRSFRIGPGFVFMLFPEVWHWYAPDKETGWDEYWVGFKGEYPARLVENGFFSPDSPVHDIGLHDSILELYHGDLRLREVRGPGLPADPWFPHHAPPRAPFQPVDQHGPDSANERIVQRAKFLLADNVATHLDIGVALPEPRPGYSRFRQIFKKCTGLSPYQYFLDLKISRAKELLLQHQYTVKEIAYMLSFDDPYYFSHLFKKKTGHPPSEWH